MCTSEYPCEDTVKSSLCKPKREVAGESQPGHHLDFRFPASRSMRKPTSVVYAPYSVIFSYSIPNKLTVGYHQHAVEGKRKSFRPLQNQGMIPLWTLVSLICLSIKLKTWTKRTLMFILALALFCPIMMIIRVTFVWSILWGWRSSLSALGHKDAETIIR